MPVAGETTEQADHTPGPWRSKVDGFGISIFAESRPHIAVAIVGKGGRVSEERDANAAFIVTACNAHADLVKALEKVRSYNVDIDAGRINYRPKDHIQVIDEALAKLSPAPTQMGAR